MSVPFDQVGPGQLARLAYQVIGSNGPINNPAGIRYLSPTDPALQSAGLSIDGGGGAPGLMMWSSAAQFASLGLSMANLGVSVAVLSEVRQISRRLESLSILMQGAVSALDRIEAKLERIDINVAEGNLRAGLSHVIASASGDGWLDLEVLHGVERELDKFTDSLDGFGYGLAPSLRLSGDVRAQVVACRDAFRGARQEAMRRHNVAVLGNPLAVLGESEVIDTRFDQLSAAVVSTLVVVGAIDEFADELAAKVFNDFFFADETKAEEFRSLVGDELGENVVDAIAAENPLVTAIARTLSPLIAEVEDLESLRQVVDEYLAAWWHSDARLLWELDAELRLYKHKPFWDQLKDWSIGQGPAVSFDLYEVDSWVRDTELEVSRAQLN